MAKVKVLIADEQSLFREGICALLNTCRDIEIVGQATNGEEAVKMVRQQTPDVVLTDMTMRTINGAEVIQQIRTEKSNVKVLLVSQNEDSQHILRGLKAGSHGYIPKSATSSELVSAITTLHNGDFFLPPLVANVLLHEYLRFGRTANNAPHDKLTAREREVIQLLYEGLKCREIATQLHIAIGTVEGYTAKIMRKLDVHNRTELIKYAISKHLINLED